jgi:acyl phosphate:glycerol-3-phosphate acyltransferase
MSTVVAGAIIAAGAYLLGGLSPGHWLVRRRTGTDVRAQGSGATGATNAGRILGRGGFALVAALDAAKGAAPVVAGRLLGFGDAWLGLFCFAAVAGHIWPAHLGFRGGKGAATAAGGWLALDWRLVAVGLAATAGIFAFLRRFAHSGLLAMPLVPLAAWWLGAPPSRIAWTTAMLALLYWAHRDNLKSLFTARGTS